MILMTQSGNKFALAMTAQYKIVTWALIQYKDIILPV